MTRLTLIVTLGILLTSCSGKNPNNSLCTTCPEMHPALTAAMDYVETHRAELQLQGQYDRMDFKRMDEDQLGMTHVRLDQFYERARVDGGELIVHLNSNLTVTSVSAAIIPGIVVDLDNQVLFMTAREIARTSFAEEGFSDLVFDNTELIVFHQNDIAYLAWSVGVYSETQLANRDYFIDAHTGAVLGFRSKVVS